MNHLRRFALASLFAATLILAVACSPSPQDAADGPAAFADLEIECQVYYRASAGQALSQGPEMIFSGQNHQASARFDDIEFQVQDYSDQEYSAKLWGTLRQLVARSPARLDQNARCSTRSSQLTWPGRYPASSRVRGVSFGDAQRC